MKFPKTIGRTDKIIRLIIGIPLTIWGIYANSWWTLLGIILIITVIFSRCTVYYLFGINTIEKK